MTRVFALVFAAGSALLAAQVDRFEVASVRAKGVPDALPLIAVEPGGRLTAPNSTLRELVRAAYGIDDNRIVGGPDWIGRDRFAIEARAQDPATTNDRLQRRPIDLHSASGAARSRPRAAALAARGPRRRQRGTPLGELRCPYASPSSWRF